MHLDATEIATVNQAYKVTLINSIVGVRSANIIGSVGEYGVENASLFGSLVHLSSKPSVLAVSIRKMHKQFTHTYENITKRIYFTVNHVSAPFVRQAHYTSAKFKIGVSEFIKCGLTAYYEFNFPAPFVRESLLKIGMKFVEEIRVKTSDTIMLVGEVMHVIVPDDAVDEQGHIDLQSLHSVGVTGCGTYYELNKIASYEKALPDCDL